MRECRSSFSATDESIQCILSSTDCVLYSMFVFDGRKFRIAMMLKMGKAIHPVNIKCSKAFSALSVFIVASIFWHLIRVDNGRFFRTREETNELCCLITFGIFNVWLSFLKSYSLELSMCRSTLIEPDQTHHDDKMSAPFAKKNVNCCLLNKKCFWWIIQFLWQSHEDKKLFDHLVEWLTKRSCVVYSSYWPMPITHPKIKLSVRFS